MTTALEEARRAIADAQAAGASEPTAPAADMVCLSSGRPGVHPDPLADVCRALFAEWLSTSRHRAY